MQVKHEFAPIYNQDSQILILGSIPSIKSREQHFYYGHPQNKFWKVLEELYQIPKLHTIEEKKQFLLKNKIALWDVIQSCEIEGSSDLTIKNVIPNDISSLLQKTNIKKIYTTGKKAYQLYQKYCYPNTKIEAIYLPSTSPANIANFTFEQLVENYQCIKE